MSNVMTDEEMAAWRARRTGKPVPTSTTSAVNNSGDGPGGAPRARDPVNTNQIPDFAFGNDSPTNPLGTEPPQPTPPNDATALEQQLQAANGRNAPLQRQIEELRSAIQARDAQIADLTRTLQAATSAVEKKKVADDIDAFDPFEGMSQEEIDALDPTAINILRKLGKNVAQRTMAKIPQESPEVLVQRALAERDKAQREEYIRNTAASLGLIELSTDPKFKAFVENDDSAGFLLNAFANAVDLASAKMLEGRVKTMLKRYEKQSGSAEQRPADTHHNLSKHLSRKPEHGDSGNSVVQLAKSPEEARRIRQQATSLSRQGRFADAEKLLASLNM